MKSIVYLSMGSFLGAGLAFCVQVILARAYSPNDYGALVAAVSVATLFTPMAGFGVPGLLLRLYGEEGKKAKRWISASLAYALISSIGVSFFLAVWAVFGPHEQLSREILFLFLPLPVANFVVTLVSAKLQLEERYEALALWQLTTNLMRVIVVVFVVGLISNSTILDIAKGYFLVALVVVGIGFRSFFILRTGEIKLVGHEYPQSKKTKEDFKRLGASIPNVAKMAWPFGLGSLFHLVYFQSDIVLLKYFEGTSSAAIYSVSFSVLAAVYLLPASIYQKFLLPKVHRWSSHDHGRLLQVYRFGNGMMLSIGGGVSLGLIAVVPWAIPLIFGPEYERSVGLLYILAWCVPLRFLASSIGSVLVTGDLMVHKVRYMGITAMVNVGLNIIMIPKFGMRGAAFSTLVSELFLLLLYLLAVRTHVFGKDALTGWNLRLRK